ncbi:MAG: PilZ domain-containing protein [Spirochaetaceae bacterium]|jgi:hypothetical protein|nr:PilZ domain-containing protein [Spirochaetaceae bacterium]
MSSLPRQKINDYYDQFRPVDVTFTKEVIQTTGLVPKEVQLKCASDFYPCVIYSTSFESAKVVANNKSGLMQKLKATNSALSIRFFFKLPTNEEQVVFLVPARMISLSSYGNSEDMSFFTLEFTSRPPDDLIEIMGRILEANMNFSKRKDERVPVTQETMRKMGIIKDVTIVIDGAARRCILREVFFAGARIITMGKVLENGEKQVYLRLEFNDPSEECTLQGRLIKVDTASSDGMYVLTIVYIDPVPMCYKVRLNDYISSVKVDSRPIQPIIQQKPPDKAIPQAEIPYTQPETDIKEQSAEPLD